jgi:hypothetical protein
VRQLLFPEGVYVEGLLLAGVGEVGVGPGDAVMAVESGVVALFVRSGDVEVERKKGATNVPCFCTVFCFGDVVPSLAVAAEPDYFDGWVLRD